MKKWIDQNSFSSLKKSIMRLPISVIERVWIHHNGNNFTAKCHTCQCEINALRHSISRLIPQPKGTHDEISNLVPVCRKCFRLASKPETKEGSETKPRPVKRECPRVLTRGPRKGEACSRLINGDHPVCQKCKGKKISLPEDEISNPVPVVSNT